MSMLQPATAAQRRLYYDADELRQRAWAPYSHFSVGAIIVDERGQQAEGVNVENASYGLTICAERIAAGAACVRGLGRWREIAVATPEPGASPCGACRQVLVELGHPDLVVIMRHHGALVACRLADLVPLAFGGEDLDAAR